PTEDLQPAEAAPTPEKTEADVQANKTDTWDDQDYEYFFGDYLDDGYRPRAPQEVKELPPIENTLSTASSLSDHLLWQLSMQIDDLKEHIEVIRHLDPKPGSRYNPTQSQYVIPDVYVMKVEDEYVVVLNEDGLPQMRISPVYRRLLDKTASDNTDETRAYVKDKFRSALWLIKSV